MCSCGEYNDLIETYWNVNFIQQGKRSKFIYDLIETYWNVNMLAKCQHLIIWVDLIETYWNVNQAEYKNLLTQRG